MNSVKLNGANDAESLRLARRGETGRPTEANQPAPPSGAKSASGADTINVSDQAATVGRLAAKVAELPDVREERVAALRARVESGNYQPSAREIADAIINQEG